MAPSVQQSENKDQVGRLSAIIISISSAENLMGTICSVDPD